MTENTNFYFTVHSFMMRELGLRGSGLIVYAIIYSFSADGVGTFYGSREMLADMSGISVSTVGKLLKELIDGGFISVVEGKNYEHKEYRVNAGMLKSGSRNSPAAQPRTTSGATENYLPGNRNSPAAQPKSTCNNKHNNKPNNKLIFNSYNGAYAPEREKEIFKEDFLVDESIAPFPDVTDTKANAEEYPIYIKDPASPSENAPSDKSKGTAEENSKTLPSEPKNSYSGSGYRKNFRGGGQNAHSSASPTYKYINFDPDEAFRIALERTEEWMAEIEERNKREARKKEST